MIITNKKGEAQVSDSNKLNNLWKVLDEFFVYYDVEFDLLSRALFRLMQGDFLGVGQFIVIRHLNKIRTRLHEANGCLLELATHYTISLSPLRIPPVITTFEIEAITTTLAKLDRAYENLYNNTIYLKGEIEK